MPEWWTYGFSDLAMFSRETYYRLFELYNRAIWPAQAVAAGAGICILALVRGGGALRGRLVGAILAASWLWVAIAFHAKRYATIHRAALEFAWAFAIEAALLVWVGVVRGRLVFEADGFWRRAGLGIFLFALALQPLAGVVFGRGWRQVEVFGVAPDPTAVGTLGVVLLAAGRTSWELLAIPLLWCAASGVMLLAIEATDAWIVLVAGGCALAAGIVLSGRRRRSSGARRLHH